GRLERGRDLLRARLARRGIDLSAALPPAALAPESLSAAEVAAVARGAAQSTSARAAHLAACALRTAAAPCLAGAAAVLAGARALRAPRPPAPAALHAVAPPAREAALDRHGDPLPAGALARLGTVRLRSEGGLSAIAFSPDGKWLAGGGWASSVVIWNAET